MNDKKPCECRVCVYGKKVRDLIHRTPVDADKALIEELYDNLIHVEDDRDFYLTLSDGCDIKHGGMGFTEAVLAIEEKRASKPSPKEEIPAPKEDVSAQRDRLRDMVNDVRGMVLTGQPDLAARIMRRIEDGVSSVRHPGGSTVGTFTSTESGAEIEYFICGHCQSAEHVLCTGLAWESGELAGCECASPDDGHRINQCCVCKWNGDRDEADDKGEPPATYSRSMSETPDGEKICSHCKDKPKKEGPKS